MLYIIYCISKRCGPCQKVAPFYDAMSVSKEFSERVVFLKVDVDESPDVAEKYAVNAMPTFIFIRNDGTIASRFSGGLVNKIEETLRSLL